MFEICQELARIANTVAGRVILTVIAAVFTFPILGVAGGILIVEALEVRLNPASIANFLMYAAFGFGGLAGIVAAWIRIAVPGETIRASPVLRQIAIWGLASGAVTAAVVVFNSAQTRLNLLSLIQFLILLLALSLLGATIGEQPNDQ